MSAIDRHVGVSDIERDPRDDEIASLRQQLDEARTIHASEVERLANQYVPPPEAQRRALITLLDTLGYGAAAAVIRAGIKGGYFVVPPRSLVFPEDAADVFADAESNAPAVILVCGDLGV